MKLHAEIGDDDHEIEIKKDGDKVFAEIDGRKYELEATEPERGVFLIKHDNRIYDVPVSTTADGRKLVTVKGREYEIKLTDPKRLRGSAGSDSHSHGAAEIKTAMPGKVVRILASIGTEVEKGTGVIVVEA